MVYLDNAATTPLNTAAISAMTHVMTETFGNPSSLHAYGRQASKELREAREEMAKQFQVPARKLIFTSGGTEGNNTAIKGYALANQARGETLDYDCYRASLCPSHHGLPGRAFWF